MVVSIISPIPGSVSVGSGNSHKLTRDQFQQVYEQGEIENKNLNRIDCQCSWRIVIVVIWYSAGSSLFHRDFPLINPRSNLIIPCYIYKMPSATGNKRVRVSGLEKYDENQTNVNCRACRSFGHSVCSKTDRFRPQANSRSIWQRRAPLRSREKAPRLPARPYP